ncbi:hypothetical protein R3P38DRAFT_3260137 [Favolaschia claudopus]|uniref:Uncharacterized protein n=1 Tax=Favolaschia claudopus TaxID=2862362 RepID=A0AAW0CS05_9AGAR
MDAMQHEIRMCALFSSSGLQEPQRKRSLDRTNSFPPLPFQETRQTTGDPLFRAIIGPEFDLVGFDPRGIARSLPRASFFATQEERVQFPPEISFNASQDAFFNSGLLLLSSLRPLALFVGRTLHLHRIPRRSILHQRNPSRPRDNL